MADVTTTTSVTDAEIEDKLPEDKRLELDARTNRLRAAADLTAAQTERIRADLAREVSIQNQTFFQSYWRPAMGWTYMLICLFDFLLAPIGLPYVWKFTGMTAYPWHPLTLEGGGLFHVAFGAVLGITSWTRGQAYIKGVG